MATLEKVIIKIQVDTKDLDPTVKKLQKLGLVSKQNAKTFKKTSQEFKKSTKDSQQSASGLEKSIGKIGIALVGAFTVTAIISFGKELARTAVQMEAFRKRAEVVFGDSIKFVEDFAKKNAISLGLTQNQFLGAAAAIGDLLVPLGLSRKRAAEMSTELVKLGGALKEFTGDQRDASEISGIVARALTGETEGLKALGVTISQSSKEFQDAVKVKIRDEGLTQDQAKAVVIYETALARSTDALSAFETNTDSLARQTSELNAQTKEFTETLATAFTPVLLAVTTELNLVTKAQKALSEADVSYFTKLKASFGIKSAQIEIARATAKANEEVAEELKKIEEEATKAEGAEKKRATTIGDLKNKITDLKKSQNELGLSAVSLAANLRQIRDVEEQLKKIFEEATEAIKKQGFEFKRLKPIVADELKIEKERDQSTEDFFKKIAANEQDAADLRQEKIELAIQAEQQLFDIIFLINESKLIAIENEKQTEIQALTDQRDQQLITEEQFINSKIALDKKFDEERAKIQRKQAIADKAANIIQVAINTAQAIVKTIAVLGAPPSPAGIAGIIAAVALGATQAALIAAQPIPKFHKGKRGEYSDEEFPALIRKSEYVIPPEQSRRHRDDLDAMLSNKFDHFVFMKYQMPIIKQYSQVAEQSTFSDFDITRHQKKHSRLVEETNQLLRSILPSMKRASYGWD